MHPRGSRENRKHPRKGQKVADNPEKEWILPGLSDFLFIVQESDALQEQPGEHPVLLAPLRIDDAAPRAFIFSFAVDGARRGQHDLPDGVLPAHRELVPMQPGDVPVTYADSSKLEEN